MTAPSHKRPPRRRPLDRVLHDANALAALEMSLAEALRQPDEEREVDEPIARGDRAVRS